jgi:glucosamine--fructose-6-phosphate aminotransferase (isomerizing)
MRDFCIPHDKAIVIESKNESLSVFCAACALQLFAYHTAALRGLDVDKPRNLAKSVTVE